MSIIRATFGRLTIDPLSRITIGHIQIEGTVLDKYGRRVSHTGGLSGKKPKDPSLGVKFIPLTDKYKQQKIQEDKELIDLVVVMIEGNIL